MKQLLFFTFLLLSKFIIAQNNEIDSLENVLKQNIADTSRVKILTRLSNIYAKPKDYYRVAKQAGELARKTNQKKHEGFSYQNIGFYYSEITLHDSAVFYYKKAAEFFNNIHFYRGAGEAYLNLGLEYQQNGSFSLAIENFNSSLKFFKKTKKKINEAHCYNSLAIVYKKQGNFPIAIENYLKALAIYEESNNKKDKASVINNIGTAYETQGDTKEAKKYYLEFLKLSKETKNKYYIAFAYSNIAGIFIKEQNNDSALAYYKKAIKIAEKNNYHIVLSWAYNGIGTTYMSMKKDDEALEFFKKSLAIREKYKLTEDIAQSNNSLGGFYLGKKDFNNAEKHYLKSYKIAKKIGEPIYIRNSAKGLAEIYENKNQTKKALDFYKTFKTMNDSILNEENTKKITSQTMQFQFEQEKKEIELKEKEKEIKYEKEKSEQQVWLNRAVGGFILMLLLALFAYLNFRQKRKDNRLLKKQKLEIQEKNKNLNELNQELQQLNEEIVSQNEEIVTQRDEIHKQHEQITDSIKYAQRIQEALLPPKEMLEEVLPEHFIFFKPRNIVSGDFYWVKKISNFTLIVAADCTGHGVPGAFMSMLGISFLNEIASKANITKASEVLTIMRNKVKQSLRQESENKSKDGMDIALCVIDNNTSDIQFSGAYNPLYIVRKDVNMEEYENEKNIKILKEKDTTLIEIKADRQPIAIYPKEKEFTNKDFKVQKGDCLYIFSDGFADQTGGEKKRKYLSKNLKKLFINLHDKNMNDQEEILDTTFHNWKADNEQIDDIVIIGIRIN